MHWLNSTDAHTHWSEEEKKPVTSKVHSSINMQIEADTDIVCLDEM